MRKIAIILAGGEGRRAGGSVPKQFQLLEGRPVVWWSLHAFREADPQTQLILVLHPGFFDEWDILQESLDAAERIDCHLCCGAADRTGSVANGLLMARELVEANGQSTSDDISVAIHDGARPLLTTDLICRGWGSVASGICAVPAIDCTSSLRFVDDPSMPVDMRQSHSVARANFMEVQTPQIFMLDDAIIAYDSRGDETYTDDASVAEHAGLSVRLYDGDCQNMKITNPGDHLIAALLLRNRHKMDYDSV